MNELWNLDASRSVRLRAIGEALDADTQPLVFDGGLIGFNDEHESEVISNVAQGQASRPAAGPRPGRQKSSWTRRGASGQAEPFRSPAIEAAHGAGFRLLAQQYEALGFEDDNGLWAVIRTEPLGSGGPQAYLLIATPINKAITPRAWAFSAVGRRAELFPLKHTNFPDASICAFTKLSGAWTADDGLLSLTDHYSLWVTKSWHRTVFGWWPGAQIGACSLYRRREFVAKESCGCESGKLYADCHLGVDSVVSEEFAREEFRRLFLTDYENRRAPPGIVDAARSRWKYLPSMAATFADRPVRDEPSIPLF